jgi:uncharacterized protein with PIN domain
MNQAQFRFYGPLNDFLRQERRQESFPYTFNDHQSVKHLVESLGVPHTEVDLILANGEPVGFSYLARDGDRISIYPRCETLDLRATSKVRPPEAPPAAFVLDGHLGKLASYLRMLGFDTLYQNDFEDAALAQISAEENRILLTRDQGLLKRRAVVHGYWVRSKDPDQQLVEVLGRFDLQGEVRPLQRCMRCNGRLLPVEKSKILDKLEEKTRRYFHEFAQCQACQQVYWKGSHWERMQSMIQKFQGE